MPLSVQQYHYAKKILVSKKEHFPFECTCAPRHWISQIDNVKKVQERIKENVENKIKKKEKGECQSRK